VLSWLSRGRAHLAEELFDSASQSHPSKGASAGV
jgi:hypothetical protein